MPILGTVASSYRSSATPTYEFIASTSLGSSTSQVTFSSLPQTYTDLVLIMSVRTARTSAYGVGYVRMEFNGDTTTSNYDYLALGQVSNAQTIASSGGNTTYTHSSGSSDYFPANMFGNLYGYLVNYSNTSGRKSGYMTGANEEFSSIPIKDMEAYRWKGENAITSIRLYGDNNFLTNSTFYLYGIKRA